MDKRVDVALILWNQDVIQLVSLLLLSRNLKSCGVEPSDGIHRMEELIVSCGPSVIVFDLDPPYDRSAEVACCLLCRFPNCSFVMTCSDSVLALKNAPWLSRHLMFQKPYEMDELANVVRSMVEHAPGSVGGIYGKLTQGAVWS
jgi:hypothetical protein